MHHQRSDSEEDGKAFKVLRRLVTEDINDEEAPILPSDSPYPRRRFKPSVELSEESPPLLLDMEYTPFARGGEKNNPNFVKESLQNLGNLVVEAIRNKPFSEDYEVFESFFDLTKARLKVIFDAIISQHKHETADLQELKQGMRHAGLVVGDEKAFARVIKQVDQDCDGNLTFEEFESVVQSLKMAHLLKSKTVESVQNECMLTNRRHQQDEPNTRVIDFTLGSTKMRSPVDRESLITFLYSARPDWAKTRWIDVISPAPFILKGLAIKYQLHPLALEDALHNEFDQGAKLDRYDNHLFLIFPGMVIKPTSTTPPSTTTTTTSSKYGSGIRPLLNKTPSVKPIPRRMESFPGIVHYNVCMFLTTDLETLITVVDHSAGGNQVFARVRKELHVSYSRLGSQNALFLMYTVLDVLVDGLLPVMDSFEEHIIHLRQNVRENASKREILFNATTDQEFLAHYHDVISELRRAKRRMSPAIRLLSHLSSQDPIVTEECRLYLRDVLDHSQEFLERIEGLMEECRALKAEHQHSIDARLTKSMAALSVVSLIFLPGQFLSSIFGMNFVWMPWIDSENGWWMFWLATFLSWIVMWFVLRKYRVF